MANLVYTTITSLDGYLEDATGSFAWAEPDPEVHAFVNELERPIGTYLYGRRLYEVMVYWETADTGPEQRPVSREYTDIWRAADKIVYSTTLDEVSSARTRLERTFDVDAVRRLKDSADHDLGVGGAGLAAVAIRAGLVDEYHQFLAPVLVGGGKRAMPDDVRIDLELVDERCFASGFVHLHHRPRH